MKTILVFIFSSFFCVNSFAQYREVEKVEPKKESSGGFQKDHLFTGGGIQLSYSSYNFIVGASPVLGYSFNRWFDAGIGFSYLYASEKDVYLGNDGNYYSNGNKTHIHDIAPVVFARVYPVKFLFVQAQYEHNFLTAKYIYGGSALPTEKAKVDVNSLLTGIGYCGGREDIGGMFYYISLSIDVLKNRNSPYVEVLGSSVQFLPILRAGIQVPLFQGRR